MRKNGAGEMIADNLREQEVIVEHVRRPEFRGREVIVSIGDVAVTILFTDRGDVWSTKAIDLRDLQVIDVLPFPMGCACCGHGRDKEHACG